MRSRAEGRLCDRIDIDCAAATGSEFGRVGILRLDDGAEFYANINPGE